VIIASLLVFGGVMFLGANIIFSWGWDTPVIKVRLAFAFFATVATLLTAATAMLLRPR